MPDSLGVRGDLETALLVLTCYLDLLKLAVLLRLAHDQLSSPEVSVLQWKADPLHADSLLQQSTPAQRTCHSKLV